MTSRARSALKFYKREAIIAQLVPGFKFIDPLSVGPIRYTHEINKILSRTGEIIICSTPDINIQKQYWIVGIKTLQLHLESGAYIKTLA